jgi:hypothetical protein
VLIYISPSIYNDDDFVTGMKKATRLYCNKKACKHRDPGVDHV